jgi:hypothetical protein
VSSRTARATQRNPVSKNQKKKKKKKERKQEKPVVMLALIPALGRQRQVNLCEFEASSAYKRQPELHSETLSQMNK